MKLRTRYPPLGTGRVRRFKIGQTPIPNPGRLKLSWYYRAVSIREVSSGGKVIISKIGKSGKGGRRAIRQSGNQAIGRWRLKTIARAIRGLGNKGRRYRIVRVENCVLRGAGLGGEDVIEGRRAAAGRRGSVATGVGGSRLRGKRLLRCARNDPCQGFFAALAMTLAQVFTTGSAFSLNNRRTRG